MLIVVSGGGGHWSQWSKSFGVGNRSKIGVVVAILWVLMVLTPEALGKLSFIPAVMIIPKVVIVSKMVVIMTALVIPI
jgi:hypothetical protein